MIDIKQLLAIYYVQFSNAVYLCCQFEHMWVHQVLTLSSSMLAPPSSVLPLIPNFVCIVYFAETALNRLDSCNEGVLEVYMKTVLRPMSVRKCCFVAVLMTLG